MKLTYVDLTAAERAYVDAERRLHRQTILALIVLVLLWVLGQVLFGDSPPQHPVITLPDAMYVQREAGE